MSQNENNSSPSPLPPTDSSSSFLGGGPKFNQAGLNIPMPGEKTADVAPPPPMGGPRVWIGILAVIALAAILWFTVGDGIHGTTQSGNYHAGIDPNDKPDVNSDQSSGN